MRSVLVESYWKYYKNTQTHTQIQTQSQHFVYTVHTYSLYMCILPILQMFHSVLSQLQQVNRFSYIVYVWHSIECCLPSKSVDTCFKFLMYFFLPSAFALHSKYDIILIWKVLKIVLHLKCGVYDCKQRSVNIDSLIFELRNDNTQYS